MLNQTVTSAVESTNLPNQLLAVRDEESQLQEQKQLSTPRSSNKEDAKSAGLVSLLRPQLVVPLLGLLIGFVLVATQHFVSNRFALETVRQQISTRVNAAAFDVKTVLGEPSVTQDSAELNRRLIAIGERYELDNVVISDKNDVVFNSVGPSGSNQSAIASVLSFDLSKPEVQAGKLSDRIYEVVENQLIVSKFSVELPATGGNFGGETQGLLTIGVDLQSPLIAKQNQLNTVVVFNALWLAVFAFLLWFLMNRVNTARLQAIVVKAQQAVSCIPVLFKGKRLPNSDSGQLAQEQPRMSSIAVAAVDSAKSSFVRSPEICDAQAVTGEIGYKTVGEGRAAPRVANAFTQETNPRRATKTSLSAVDDSELDAVKSVDRNLAPAEQMDAENNLYQQRKLQTVGQISTGIAHDFNNLLNVIVGRLELLAMDISDSEHRRLLNEADCAAQMGARLTRRIVSFVEQSPAESTVLNLNELVFNTIDLLRSTVGKTVSVSSSLHSGLWNTQSNASEIENMLINLAINAKDAMPGGGTLNIETKNVSLCEEDTEELCLSAGDYVRLSMTDSGSGMHDDVKTRIFDPFFTTKEAGKGTGLGLTTIYEFVTQLGGTVKVYSEIRHGTVIDVYFPRMTESVSTTPSAPLVSTPPVDSDMGILVVEDNDMIRTVTVNLLTVLGHRVLQASSGSEAIKRLDVDRDVDIVFTDIEMGGGLSGFDVAEWVQDNLPNCKIVLTSGHSEQIFKANDICSENLSLLQKPYNLDDLKHMLKGAEPKSVVS